MLFASVAAVCVTVRRGGGPLPTAFRLATRGLRWSRPGILTGRLELDVPRRLRGRGAQMARLGESSSVTPQVPLLTDGESQNFAGGAGIYQPDWDEIDLGDDFLPGRGEFDRAKNRGDGDARRNRNTNPHRNIPGLGAYEDDGSVPWMRRMMPGFDENFAGTDLDDDDVAAVGEKKSVENKKPVDADSFARAFPNGAPRLRPSVLSEKTPERGWEDSSDDTAYTESPYETAFENGGGHFQQGGKTGAAYEDDLGVGELEESYAASAQVSERQQRFMVSKERQQENELARWRALRGTKNADPKRAKAKSDAALGAATAGGGADGGGDLRRGMGGADGNTRNAWGDYTPLPYDPATDRLPLDYGYAYDYGYDARGRDDGENEKSLYSHLGMQAQTGQSRDANLGVGVPGLASHVAYAGDGIPGLGTSPSAAGTTRVLLSVKPGEWRLAYMQLASLKRVSPKTLQHVTVLSYDSTTHAACLALGNGRDQGVDCFLDTQFVDLFGDFSFGLDGHDEEVDATYSTKLSWRKIHAAYTLLGQETPVVLLDADVVFLKDPTPGWRDAMRNYDVTVNAFVGSVDQAQRNADTKIVLLPAAQKTKQLVRNWLRGESIAGLGDTRNQPGLDGRTQAGFDDRTQAGFDDETPVNRAPERDYFNFVLVPTEAGHAKIHAFSAREFANFVTAHKGNDGAFEGVFAVTGGFCASLKAKELFLKSTLEEKARAERVLQKEKATASGRHDRASRPGVTEDGDDGDEEFYESSDSSSRASRTAKSAARRVDRIAARRKTRAAKRNKGLPLITEIDPHTHAAAVGVSGGNVGLDASTDDRNENWPPTAVACDAEKRRAAFRGEFLVTENRKVEWD